MNTPHVIQWLNNLFNVVSRGLYFVDYWSELQEEVQLGAAAATLNLPDVVVADLPNGMTPVKCTALFVFRAVENTYAGNNALDGATVAATSQVIQVRSDAPGAWRDSINFVDANFSLITETREGSGAVFGQANIDVEVDENDTYEFRWLLAKSLQNNINFNDVQTGLRVWFSG